MAEREKNANRQKVKEMKHKANSKKLLPLLFLPLLILQGCCANGLSVRSSAQTDNEVAEFLECQANPDCQHKGKADEGVIRALISWAELGSE